MYIFWLWYMYFSSKLSWKLHIEVWIIFAEFGWEWLRFRCVLEAEPSLNSVRRERAFECANVECETNFTAVIPHSGKTGLRTDRQIFPARCLYGPRYRCAPDRQRAGNIRQRGTTDPFSRKRSSVPRLLFVWSGEYRTLFRQKGPIFPASIQTAGNIVPGEYRTRGT